MIPAHAAALKEARGLSQAGKAARALFAYQRFLVFEPNSVDGWAEYAGLLRRSDRLEEARKACRRALTIDPAHTGAANTLGQILIQEEDWPELRREIEHRIAHHSGAEREWEQSGVTLMFGDMPLGWHQYESRWSIPGLIGPVRQFSQPLWNGATFSGSILLHWEQGLGDTLMFIRYAPLVKGRGGRVIAEVQNSLASVVATCPGIDEVVPYGDPLPHFDLRFPLLSLPAVFETELDSIPAHIPYLHVPDEIPHRESIARVLAPTEGLVRIGLVWAGSAVNVYDPHRSIPAAVLKGLTKVPGAVWHSFQPGWKGEPPFPNIVPFGPMLSNFADTAYALSSMDLVITVDTAVAHLAGAMGIPTLLLVACIPDWRWLMGRSDTPWYPTMRIYRQPTHGDWQSVIKRVVSDLIAGA